MKTIVHVTQRIKALQMGLFLNRQAAVKGILLLGLCLFSAVGYAQINMVDSTAQAITYWDKGEMQSYAVSYDKIQLKEADTVSKLTINYKIDITVTDSTATSYIIECKYHSYEVIGTNPEQVMAMQKYTKVDEGQTIYIKTNELGTFEEVVNWKQVKAVSDKKIAALEASPSLSKEEAKLVSDAKLIYATKEGIEAQVLKDIKQMLYFNGMAYTLNEGLVFEDKLANMMDPKKPFDAHVTLSMIELSEEDNAFILQSNTVLDKNQLTEASLAYINRNRKKEKKDLITIEQLGDLRNETQLYTQQHVTGWVISSLQTVTVTGVGGFTSIEERYMEIL